MELFNRAELLLGSRVMEDIASRKIILFGVGGVGSWCAEALIRTGVHNLTIVDCDNVSESNVNRQAEATTLTIGKIKVEAMKEHLLAINPDAQITAINKMYNEDNSDSFHLEQYDYVIDCIDSLKDKMTLIIKASEVSTVFSSMGAALKIDPTQVKVAEMWKVRGCPLGAALRKRMKRAQLKPAKNVMCVYSEELLTNKNTTSETCNYKAVINGSLVHITAIFGFTLAGLVLQDINRLCEK